VRRIPITGILPIVMMVSLLRLSPLNLSINVFPDGRSTNMAVYAPSCN